MSNGFRCPECRGYATKCVSAWDSPDSLVRDFECGCGCVFSTEMSETLRTPDPAHVPGGVWTDARWDPSPRGDGWLVELLAMRWDE